MTVDIAQPLVSISLAYLQAPGAIEAEVLLRARRPDPTVASLVYVAVAHSDHSRYTRITAISPHTAARRILEAR